MNTSNDDSQINICSSGAITDEEFIRLFEASIKVDNYAAYKCRENGEVFLALSQSDSPEKPIAVVPMLNLLQAIKVVLNDLPQ